MIFVSKYINTIYISNKISTKNKNIMNTEKNVATQLLKCKAVKLQPENPFTWASGWKSPIYCDNRRTLSYPALRSIITEYLIANIRLRFGEFDVIASVATGAIPQGAIVSDCLEKPFCYIRPEPKGHGLGNQIEGVLEPGQRVVIIEDLISTGGSSLKAIKAVRDAGAEVVGMIAIFTYGFQKAISAFEEANVALVTLSDYETLVKVAIKNGYIKPNQLELLNEWRLSPDTWGK